MANFPTSPAVGEQFSTSKVTYRWNGSAWDILEGVKQGTITEYPAGTSDTTLLCHGEAFTDSSLTGRTITNNGATLVTDQKKFGTGSISFDGSNDYLSLGLADFTTDCTTDFTYDFWVRFETVNTRKGLISNETYDDIEIELTNDNKIFAHFRNPGGTGFGGAGSKNDFVTGQWYHIAIIREGSEFKVWIDGVLDNTISGFTGAIRSRGSELRIGRYHTGYHFHGQIDELRFQTKAMWTGTSAQSVPTAAAADPATSPVGNLQFTEGSEPDATAGASTLYATSDGMFVKNSSGTVSPLVAGASGTATSVELPSITSTPSAIASTGQMVHWDRSAEGDATIKLLLNGEDMTDSSSGNANVTYTGTDPVSTTQKKYGNSSLKISSDTVVTVPASSDYDFGTGNFTISAWLYCQSSGHGDWGGLVAFTPYSSGSPSGYLHNIRCYQGTQELACSTSGGYIRTGHTMATNTWFHFAMVREGEFLKFYINGTLVYTYALAAGLDFVLGNEGKIQIGQSWHDYYAVSGAGPHAWDGYIDDFCIQSGAKWTADFTPPTSQLAGGATSGLYYVAPDGTATLIKGDS